MEKSKGDNDAFVGRYLDGRYRIVKRIGHGAYGSVYGAVRCDTGEPVAVKRLHSYANRTTIERFILEGHICRALVHPNIVQMHEMLKDNGIVCIIMEFVKGQSLERYLTQDHRVFTIDEILSIARQVADGLEYAHKRGVIHRDLKAENIMLIPREDGSFGVKILDFGLAKLMRHKTNLTTPGMVLGSPAYMSPEQCVGGKKDEGIDIYAFGIVLYYMVCGHLPFESSDTRILMRDHCKSPVPPIVRPNGERIPGALAHIILRCLEKQRKDRYADFGEVLRALEMQPPKSRTVVLCVAVFIVLWIALLTVFVFFR